MQTGNLPNISRRKKTTSEPKSTLDTVGTQYENLTARLEAVGAETDDRGVFGRFLNLEQNQGPVGDFFELWDRLGQTIKGGVAGSVDGRPLQAAWEGLSGKSEMTGLDLQVKLGLTTESEIEAMTGIEKFARNIFTDIITDPLTYLPAGTITGGVSKLNKKIGALILGSGGETKAIKEVTENFITKQLLLISDDFSKAIDDVVLKTGKSQDDAAMEVLERFKKEGRVFDDGDQILDNINVKQADGSYKQVSREEYVADLKARYDQLTKAQKVEIDGFNKLFNSVNERFANNPRIKTVINKVADRAEDIAVYYRVGKAGKEKWVRVFNIDAKLYNNAFGKTFMMGKQTRAGEIYEFVFGARSQLDPASRELVEQMFKIKVGADETIGEVIERVYRGINLSPTGNKGINFRNDFPEQYKQLKELFKQISKNQGLDYYYIGNADGGKFIKADQLLDTVNWDKAVAGWGSTAGQKQWRFDIRPGNINLDDYDDALDDIIKELAQIDGVLDEKFVRKTTREVGILTALSEADTMFREPAQILKNTIDDVRRLFNWKLGLTDDYAQLINRMGAEDAQIIHQKGRRLVRLSEKAIQRNPDAEKIIQELMDLGAEVSEINGVRTVIIPESNRTGKEIFGLFRDRAKNGDDFLNIPIYSSGANAADNVLFQINQAVETAMPGTKNAFKFRQKGNKSFLELDQLDFNEFNKLYTTGLLDNSTINLGRKQVNRNYLDFYIENEELVKEYIALQDDIIKTFEDVLGPQNMPDFIKTTNGYTRHKLSQQGIDYLKATQPLARSQYIKGGIDLMQNRTYLGTAEDINAGLKAWYNVDVDIMDTNITNSISDLLRVGVIKRESGMVMRSLLNNADEAGKPLFTIVDNTVGSSLGSSYEYIDDFNGVFGNISKNLSPADQKILNDYLAKHGFVKGKKAIALNKSAYGIMKRIDNAYVDIPKWLKNYDKILGGWKSFTLLTPGFHLNNYVGNAMNSYLVGMNFADQGVYTARALGNMQQYDTLMQKINSLARPGETIEQVMRRLEPQDREIFESLYHYYADGVSMKFSGVRDIKPMTRTLREGGQRNLLDNVVDANFKLSENADDLQRYALYQWGYDKELAKLRQAGGLTEEAMKLKARTTATNTVYNSLFDYRNYTRFEQDVIKRLVPFYTFMKNNLVFQTKNILRNPGQYAKVGRAYNYYVSDIAGITENDMPDYARDNMWLPLPMTVSSDDKQMISFLRTNMPLAEFMEFVDEPFKRGVTSLAFPIKIPIELGAGVDLFTGQELREFPGEQNRLADDAGVLPFLRDSKGTFALSGDPIAQKIMNDLGLRVPARYMTLALDMADAAAGYQDPATTLLDALERLGVATTKELSNVQLTNLYQDLEQRRIDRKQWEQETGNKLPTLDELGLR